MKADRLLINGQIVTLEDAQPAAEALAIKDGRIIAIGSTNEIRSAYQSEHILDLHGNTVVPGFIDSHVHFIGTGLNLLGVRVNEARSAEEVVERIGEAARRSKPGEFVLASGLDLNKFAVQRMPTLAELDRVAPEHPVFIDRVDSHSCVVNTKMLEYMHIPAEVIGVERDAEGKPTGFIWKEANSYARKQLLDAIPLEMRVKAARAAADVAVKVGITTVHALEGGPLFDDYDVEALLKVQAELPVHIVIWFQTMDVERIKSYGLNRAGGCIVLDGSFTSRTAALDEDYSDDPGNKGVLYYDQETLDAFVEKAHLAGMQVSVHVLGERAIEQILSSYEKVLQRYPREDVRFRLEHFELPTGEQIERACKLGVILSMQPSFEYYWGGDKGMYGARLGERAQRTNPFRSIYEKGGMIVGGSDSDVTDMNPLVGIQGAMTHCNPKERLDAVEALKLFTYNPAYSVYEENERGTIKVGKFADLTILDQNPLKVNADKIDQIEVLMTVVEGKTVYVK